MKIKAPWKVKAQVVPVSQLEEFSTDKMFSVFQKYYNGVSRERFLTDLSEKNDVILLLDSESQEICGFSTLLCKYLTVRKKKVLGVFSGDTVLERQYWGSPALGIRFLIYLFQLKLKHPFTPVYWFLISKGYKTYLLMAKNFPDFYPDYRRETPVFEKYLMNEFYSAKFGNAYSSAKGIISHGAQETCKLKAEVAPVTNEMRQKSQEIAFFEKINPGWKQGEELACLAKMTFSMPFRYFLKKTVLRHFNRKPISVQTPVLPSAASFGTPYGK